MHEFGIAQDILRIVCNEAELHKANKIYKVKLKMGNLCGITQEHLQNAFDLISKDTLASGAKLEVKDIPGNGFLINDIELETENERGKR